MKIRITPLLLSIALPLAFYLWVGASQVISFFPQYDDAYNATIAKNLAQGYGYASSFDSRILFNPEVTTGPSLVIPAAILIKIFGAAYWVPAFTVFIISFLLVFLISKIFIGYLKDNCIIDADKSSDWVSAALSLLLLNLFWVGEISSIAFIGEFPAALLFCAGALIVFMSPRSKARIFYGGVLLGLSFVTKLVAMILVAPLFLVWVAVLLCDNTEKTLSEKNISCVAVLCFSIALPTLLFEFYKISTLGFVDYYHLKDIEYRFFKTHGSGISQLSYSSGVFDNVLTNFKRNFHSLQVNSGGVIRIYVYLILFTSIVVAQIHKLYKKANNTNLDHLALGLVFSVMAYVIWWLFFNPAGWYRHVSMAIVVFSLSVMASGFALLGKKMLHLSGVILLFWMLFSPFKWLSLLHLSQIPKAQLYAVQDTSQFLSELKLEGKTLLGCGWWANRRLEYFMGESLNFKQCYSDNFKDSVLVIDRSYWDWEKSVATKNIEARCPKLIYDKNLFQVFQCK